MASHWPRPDWASSARSLSAAAELLTADLCPLGQAQSGEALPRAKPSRPRRWAARVVPAGKKVIVTSRGYKVVDCG